MKVLVVGLGAVGQRHLRNLRTLTGPDTTILAYRARGLSHVLSETLKVIPDQALDAEFGVRMFGDLTEALAERPDVTFVCNPTSLHVPVALAAARAGSHLFIEKPLSDSTEGINELISVIEDNRLAGLVGYQLRFHPCLRAVRALLERGAIGRVLAVRIEVGEHLADWHPYEDYRQSYAAKRHLGGGVVLTQIHELDYATWLFGPPKRVFAVGGHLSRLVVDVEDTASILMECTVDGRGVPVHVQQDYLQRPPARTCQVLGDAGKILVDLRQSTLQLFDDRGQLMPTEPIAPFERNQLFLDQLAHFLACVRGDEVPISTVTDAAGSLRVALAAKESMTTGRVVDVKM
ncbi:MAG: Gfo/Idh/MocA family oxidoreductase [Acidobacteria bacterium]|nr:Gfo/Idh/MocA family oxidoreductase [Acidobacteriota bacterium]